MSAPDTSSAPRRDPARRDDDASGTGRRETGPSTPAGDGAQAGGPHACFPPAPDPRPASAGAAPLPAPSPRPATLPDQAARPDTAAAAVQEAPAAPPARPRAHAAPASGTEATRAAPVAAADAVEEPAPPGPSEAAGRPAPGVGAAATGTTAPPPPEARFLRWLVTALALTMIGGMISIVALLALRLPGPPGPGPGPQPPGAAGLPALPETIALPPGRRAVAVTFGPGWLALVLDDGSIAIHDAETGTLRSSLRPE